MPSISDLKIYGDEPSWQPSYKDDADRRCAILKALNWYNYMSDAREHKKWLIDYLKSNQYDKQIIENISRLLPEQIEISREDMPNTNGFKTGTFARMISMGAPLDEYDINNLKNAICFLNDKSVNTHRTSVSPRQNVQRNIEDNFSKIVEYFEIKCDDVLTNRKTISQSIKDISKNQKTSIDEVRDYLSSVKTIYCKKIIEHYDSLYCEICDVIKGNDTQLVEGYSCYSSTSLKNLKVFLEQIISECKQKINTAPKTTRIRKKRRKPPAEIVKKLKYKKDDTELGLVSILPSKIVDCQKLVVYNTKLRTITLYEADSAHGLSIKGTTVIGYDEKKSKTKKIRKPKDFFQKISNKGIRAFKTTFDSIKCVEKPAKGRINSDTILYGVYE
jgi:hypothetical protein